MFLQKKAAALPKQEAVPEQEEEEAVHEENEWGREPFVRETTWKSKSSGREHEIII